MNLILMGAPGAGKGTQAELISKREGIPAISTGQILRNAMKAGTELGLEARSYVESGALVPDATVIGIVKEYLESEECGNGFILDGFPRSTAQARALKDLGVRIDAVLTINVSDERIVRRMSGRRVCECGASYHVDYLPPAKEGKPFAACRRGSRSPGLHVARWYRRIRNAPIATRGTDARPRKSSARKRSFAHIPCVGLRHPSERRESTPVSKTCHSA